MAAFVTRLKKQVPNDFIDDIDLRLLFSNMSSNALRLALKRAVDGGYLITLKKGFYLWTEDHRRRSLSKFAIANKLYSPSYISFESALSYHGLIPEAVYTVTSAHKARKTNTYTTPIGVFSYQYIPDFSLGLGISYEKTVDGNHFLIASAAKALFDLIYVSRKTYSSLRQLEDDLRIDTNELSDQMHDVTPDDIDHLVSAYRKKTTASLGQLLKKELLK